MFQTMSHSHGNDFFRSFQHIRIDPADTGIAAKPSKLPFSVLPRGYGNFFYGFLYCELTSQAGGHFSITNRLCCGRALLQISAFQKLRNLIGKPLFHHPHNAAADSIMQNGTIFVCQTDPADIKDRRGSVRFVIPLRLCFAGCFKNLKGAYDAHSVIGVNGRSGGRIHSI